MTIGAFPKASFIPRETAVDQPWMGALKNCGDPEMPRQPHRERAGLGGWVPILLPPPELEVLLLCTLPNLGNGSRNETAHFMCKEGESCFLSKKNDRYEGQGGSQVVCVPGEGRIDVQTAASVGARLAVSQTRG